VDAIETGTSTPRTNSARPQGWFRVDKEGLAKLMRRRGPHWVLAELLQNAWASRACSRPSRRIGLTSPRQRASFQGDPPGKPVHRTALWI